MEYTPDFIINTDYSQEFSVEKMENDRSKAMKQAERRKTARPLFKILGGNYVYDKGTFTVSYGEPGYFERRYRSFSMQKFHPKREKTTTVMEEIRKTNIEDGKNVWCYPGISFYNRLGADQREAHTFILPLRNSLSRKINDEINTNDFLFGEDVLQMLLDACPVLESAKPYAVIADRKDTLFLVYTFKNNILNRKQDAELLLQVLADFTDTDIAECLRKNPCSIPFPCPNTINHENQKEIKVFWNQRYKETSLSVYMEWLRKDLEDDTFFHKILSSGCARDDGTVSGNLHFKDYCIKYYGREFCLTNENYTEPVYTGNRTRKNSGNLQDLNWMAGFTDKTDLEELDFYTFCSIVNKADKYVHKSIRSVKDIDYSSTPGKFLQDLRRIFEERNGNMDGMQRAFIYHLTVTMIYCRANDQEIWAIVNDFNRKMRPPLPEVSAKAIVSSCLNRRGQDKISAAKIRKELRLSESFIMNRAKICYNKERILLRKRRTSRKTNAYRKKQTEKRRNSRIRAVRDVYCKGGSLKEMGEASGWSRNTVKKYLRIIILDMREKYIAWCLKMDVCADPAEIKIPPRFLRLSKIMNGNELNIWVLRFTMKILFENNS